MKIQLLLSMLFDLLQHRRLTARYFTEKYRLSSRTVYRYLNELSACVPLCILRGRAGGVTLDDRYKLPTDFLTETEYGATMYALERAYAQTAQSEFLQAKQKIAASYKPQNDELFDLEADA